MRWLADKLQSEVCPLLTRKLEGAAIVFYNGANKVLSILEEEIENGVLLTLQGELRSDAAHELLDELTALATVGVNVVLDFEGVTFITSTILDALLTAQQTMDSMGKGTMLLRKLPQDIYYQFEKTGTSELLMIE